MSKIIGVSLVVLSFVLVCSCDSSGGKNDLGYSDMNKGCDELITNFEACGGDVQGTWKFEKQCADIEITVEELEMLLKMCPGADMGVAGSMQGTVVVDATTITTNIISQKMVMRMFLPEICLQQSQTDCSVLEASIKDGMGQQQPGAEVSCLSSGGCDCYVGMSMGGESDTMDYTLDEIGGEQVMVISTPEGEMYQPYCVTGNQLVVAQTEEDEEMSGEMYMKLTKQSW